MRLFPAVEAGATSRVQCLYHHFEEGGKVGAWRARC